MKGDYENQNPNTSFEVSRQIPYAICQNPLQLKLQTVFESYFRKNIRQLGSRCLVGPGKMHL
ncbi:hypothetical protein Csa_002499 [Cucumis sativus]|uniref:Uncharacterized protein n=1 Tax=Cucumis sativus TaxID=3659 RepID=A0A0A0LCT0_CUCSA|nr:hypothetical protein Csa_002499 [Cucumis sativus]